MEGLRNSRASGLGRHAIPVGCVSPRARARGQALVLFAVFAAVLCISVVVLFNSGQLVNRKVELTNTADAAAYSVAVRQARAYNYAAYMNRARVANEAAIAQMVSIWSWENMFHEHARVGHDVGVAITFAPVPGFAQAIGTAMRTAYRALERVMGQVRNITHDALHVVAFVPGVDNIVGGLSWMNEAYAASAQLLLSDLASADGVLVARGVVAANDPEGGSRIPALAIAYLQSQLLKAHTGLFDDGFLSRYDPGNSANEGMDRLRNVVMASRDRFSADRGVNVSTPFLSFGSFGGTDLVEYDRWVAMDTMMLELTFAGFILDLIGIGSDIPLGYGGAQAIQRRGNNLPGFDSIQAGEEGGPGWYSHDHPQQYDPFGGAGDTNAASLANRFPVPSLQRPSTLPPSSRNSLNQRQAAYLEGYRGLQGYHDVRDDFAESPQGERAGPRFTIYVVADRDTARTSEDIDGIGGPEGGLIELEADLAGDEISAIASAQTYFNRPPANALFSRLVPRSWGSGAQVPRSDQQLESGSLFSPYWQAKLVETLPEEYAAAGVVGSL